VLEGVERLVNLAAERATDDITAATARGDVEALSRTDDHFAAVGREEQTVRLARTIGVPLRYFVAKRYHGPFLIVAERMEQIHAWLAERGLAWQFEPAYTRMIPAHYLVEIDQVGCPDPVPRYRRFFNPAIGNGSSDIAAAGRAYAEAARDALVRWMHTLPPEEPIAVAFSGGVDSTAVLLLAREASKVIGRDPALVRAFTLDLDQGIDAAQAERTVAALGVSDCWERIVVPAERYDLAAATRVIEDYHPMDVECAAAGLALLGGIRARYPRLRYLLDGDGGDENLKAYPPEDSDLTLSSILRNPLLYQEGWGVDAIKHSLVYSGGLSRGYVRTYAPARFFGFDAFSPFTVRSVIAAAAAIPFEEMLAGDQRRLSTLKQDVVRAGVQAVTGIDMPTNEKRRFQDGLTASPRPRVTKAWCRRVFERDWEDRLRAAEDGVRRSGNEMQVGT
jgi:asparagine synthase (glutamine-hydrolysing)